MPHAMAGPLETAWALTRDHLDGLSTNECLRRPARVGLHVHREAAEIGHARFVLAVPPEGDA